MFVNLASCQLNWDGLFLGKDLDIAFGHWWIDSDCAGCNPSENFLGPIMLIHETLVRPPKVDVLSWSFTRWAMSHTAFHGLSRAFNQS